MLDTLWDPAERSWECWPTAFALHRLVAPVRLCPAWCTVQHNLGTRLVSCRGKAPSLPLEPLTPLHNEKTSLKSLGLTAEKEQHIWGMRPNLVLPALAMTMVIGVVMLVASAMMQPE